MPDGLLNQLVELFLLPGNFLARLPQALAPEMFGIAATKPLVVAGLASTYWLALGITGYRIYSYCLAILVHTRVRLNSWKNSVQRFFRIRRIRAACAGLLFDPNQSPDETIQMEAIEIDDNSRHVLALARTLRGAAGINCHLIAQQLNISQHKARRICRDLEKLQLLSRVPAPKPAKIAYELTSAGKLFVDITRPREKA